MKSNLKLVENAVQLPMPKLSRSTNEQIAEKKKRGRPRIMPIAIIEEPPSPPVEIVEKKKRGRPRIMPVAIIEEQSPPPPPPVEITKKKKRGRPKKLII